MSKPTLALALAVAACGGAPPKTTIVPPPAPAPAPAPVADEIRDMATLADSGPGLKQFPSADAIVAMARDDVSLAKDGTVTSHHKSIVKILDAQRGKAKFADVHVQFDSKRQTLTLQTTRTITKDGQVHAASGDEIGDIVPPRLADATMYSDVRERVVSFPAVDTNSVVELEYTKVTKPSASAAMGGELLLAAWDPSMTRIVTITAPIGVTPKLSVERIAVAPVETVDDKAGTHTYTYTITNQPDRHTEWDEVNEAAVLPRLVFGFKSDWSSALAPVVAEYAKAGVSAAIKAQADRVVAHAKTDAERARALFAFVAHDIRSVDVPLGWAGYEPSSSDEVLTNRYADDTDKVGLFVAMCAAEKLNATPVFVRTGKVPVIASVPTVAQFDRVIAKVMVDGKDVWLDPSDDNGQYGIAFAGQDNLSLPIDKTVTAPVMFAAMDPSTSVSRVVATMKVGPNGDLDATYAYELSGAYARTASAQLRALKGDNLKQFFAQQAGGIAPGAIDKGHDVSDTMSVTGPIKISQRVAAPGYSMMQGNFRVLEIPDAPLDVASNVPQARQSTRTTPLWIGTPRIEKSDISVQVPAGWKVAYVPPAFEGASAGIKYAGGCTASGAVINCHNEVIVDQIALPADRYAGYRDAMAKVSAYERRVVILTK
ncbi:MAG TPA: DUF3857 and transglutaminase domain-containing protein [Kofleriaceae bacterium]|nr:DUF3857 and transglutaminase domain-containing protein [Kofleriaceae bacterium]